MTITKEEAETSFSGGPGWTVLSFVLAGIIIAYHTWRFGR